MPSQVLTEEQKARRYATNLRWRQRNRAKLAAIQRAKRQVILDNPETAAAYRAKNTLEGNLARRADPRRFMLSQARVRCRKRGLEFGLVLSDLPITNTCDCCGTALKVGGGGFSDVSPSLDRVDPLGGYVPGNVAIICWRCNDVKRDGSIAEHLRIVTYMRRHRAPEKG